MDSETPNQNNVVRPDIPVPDALALQEGRNQHEHKLELTKQGQLGRLFGSGVEKSGNVAALVIVFSFALLTFALLTIVFFYSKAPEQSGTEEFFFKLLSPVASLITLALGYLFGSSGGDKK